MYLPTEQVMDEKCQAIFAEATNIVSLTDISSPSEKYVPVMKWKEDTYLSQ